MALIARGVETEALLTICTRDRVSAVDEQGFAVAQRHFRLTSGPSRSSLSPTPRACRRAQHRL